MVLNFLPHNVIHFFLHLRRIDPLLGWASVDGAPRLSIDDAKKQINTPWDALPGIPVQPLSWGDAEPLLKALAGDPLPDPSWAGLSFFLAVETPEKPLDTHQTYLFPIEQAGEWLGAMFHPNQRPNLEWNWQF